MLILPKESVPKRYRILFASVLLLVVNIYSLGHAQMASEGGPQKPDPAQEIPAANPTITNEDCLSCHSDASMAPLVDEEKYKTSIHGQNLCISCHADLATGDFPHDTPAPVNCGTCHAKEQEQFHDSLHGKALADGDKLAPRCGSCHGDHDILAVNDPNSKVSPFQIPFVCGSCHSEGKPVTLQRTIHEDHILENYSESMHAEGLLKKGLTVSATCSSCHQSHLILPHTDPRSSIARGNIVKTCLQCHTEIERVHRKIIKGELWEKESRIIPVCVDCHQPHKARKIFYEQGVADKDCLTCHSRNDIISSQDGRSLFVDITQTNDSVHAKVSCAQCHTEVSVSKIRACETITQKVDCAVCHNQQGTLYQQGIHGKLFNEGNPNAPSCTECHGTHAVLSQKNINSPSYPTNVPTLCARCHREQGKAAVLYKGNEHNINANYVESIHGKGLLKSGLIVTATCTSCHSAHKQLSASDTASTVNRVNIASTCAQCHQGVYEKYMRSVHAVGHGKNSESLPACNDCHSAHTIKRTDMNEFKFDIMDKCGKCHQDIAKTYFETVHGKVATLGYTKSAKCHDCHGSHETLPTSDPRSTLSHENIVGTCQKCHQGAPRQFAGYLTHATHHNPKKYPWVFWTFWFMTGLLVFTFTLSIIHTLLWLPKSLELRRLHSAEARDLSKKQYVRFPIFYRVLHMIMIISFLTLTTTGMTLKFSYTPWALFISRLLGGVEVTGFLHRCAAVALFGLFVAHLWHLIFLKQSGTKSFKQLLFGPDSILFSKKDLQELIASIKWYTGKGEYPRYGRWTYWEKFDYFAVLWGIMVIGISGLILWFPEAFTHVLPGWAINVATIIHSDEALLAAGFIFTIHFFNTHFRPEKFPMDTVIFTGRMSIEELKRERPAEYEEMVASGKLEENTAEPMTPRRVLAFRIFGWISLTIGLILVVCIIYTMIFGYK